MFKTKDNIAGTGKFLFRACLVASGQLRLRYRDSKNCRGSTEIIIKKTGAHLEKINLGIGAVTMLKQFPKINESICPYEFDEVSSFAKSLIIDIDITVPVAVYSTGEMTYMQLARYKLQGNSLYFDNEHQFSVNLINFSQKIKNIVQNYSRTITRFDTRKSYLDERRSSLFYLGSMYFSKIWSTKT